MNYDIKALQNFNLDFFSHGKVQIYERLPKFLTY